MKANKRTKRGTPKGAGRGKKGSVKRSATKKARVSAPKSGPRRAAAAKAPRQRASSGATQEIELQAAVLQRLLRHFDERKDVQNIELMILAGFCRNCLSRWFVEAAQERGLEVDLERAREKIYGMPYSEWKERHQPAATEDQLRRLDEVERRKQAASGAKTKDGATKTQ